MSMKTGSRTTETIQSVESYCRIKYFFVSRLNELLLLLPLEKIGNTRAGEGD